MFVLTGAVKLADDKNWILLV